MASDIPEFNAILAELKAGKTAIPVTIRTFLSWANVQRRTPRHVEYINKELAKVGLRTVPSYLDIWVDTPITFEVVSDHKTEDVKQEQPTADLKSQNADDPSFKIARIKSANTPPLSVKPNASLQEATTLMLSRNFSQLPVMTTERDVKGVISWSSIGARLAVHTDGPDVQTYMDPPEEVSISATIFAAIKVILEHNYVLVRASDRKISGIVTSHDIALQFEEVSTPFLLLSDIENSLRSLIASKLKLADIRKACKAEYLPNDFSSVNELTFGNYVSTLQHEENWTKIGFHLDRKTFCSELQFINDIRNEFMHFDPEPLGDDDLAKLRHMAKMLDMLRNVGAF